MTKLSDTNFTVLHEVFPRGRYMYFGKFVVNFLKHSNVVRFAMQDTSYKVLIKINSKGKAWPTYKGTQLSIEDKQSLFKLICDLNSDFLETVVAIGRDTHTCCACGAELTDPESVARGIGPYCAKKIGL